MTTLPTLVITLRTSTYRMSYHACLLADLKFASVPIILSHLNRHNCCMLPRVALYRAL